jgi:hypothetical protein
MSTVRVSAQFDSSKRSAQDVVLKPEVVPSDVGSTSSSKHSTGDPYPAVATLEESV